MTFTLKKLKALFILLLIFSVGGLFYVGLSGADNKTVRASAAVQCEYLIAGGSSAYAVYESTDGGVNYAASDIVIPASIDLLIPLIEADMGANTSANITLAESYSGGAISGGFSMGSDGYLSFTNANKTFVLKGTLTSTLGYADALTAKGVIDINGGEIISQLNAENSSSALNSYVFAVSSGNLTIQGGLINARGYKTLGVYASGTGSVSVTGGTISAAGDGAMSLYTTSTGAINISSGTVTSSFDGKCDGENYVGGTIYAGGSSEINISGGIVENTYSTETFNKYAVTVYVTGSATVNATAGTVSADYGAAILFENSTADGAVNIGGTAQFVSDCNNMDSGAVYMTGGAGRLVVEGGTISNTASSYAVYASTDGEVEISGGNITATAASALFTTSPNFSVSGTASISATGGLSSTGVVRYGGNGGRYYFYMTGGSITATAGLCGIYTVSTCNVVVTGGSITSATSAAIYSNATAANFSLAIGGSATVTSAADNTVTLKGGSLTVNGSANVSNTNTDASSAAIMTSGIRTRTVISGGSVCATNGYAFNSTATNAANSSVLIEGGAISSVNGVALRHDSVTVPLTIMGGQITSTNSTALQNVKDVAVNISGGTVSSTNGIAIANMGKGLLTLTGGTVTTSFASGAAISLSDGTADVTVLSVRGVDSAHNVSVKNLSTNANAVTIMNAAAGNIQIGGNCKIEASGGTAVKNTGLGGINVTAGEINGGAGAAITNISTGAIVVSGGLITSANAEVNGATVILSDIVSKDVKLTVSNGEIKNTSTNALSNAILNNGMNGVSVTGGTVSATGGNAVNLANNGSLTVTGGTITTATGRAVYVNSASAVNISDCTVSATAGGVAIYHNSVSTVRISQSTANNTNITSANAQYTEGTIVLAAGGASDLVLEITGGTVTNTASSSVYASAIINKLLGKVSVTGGNVNAYGKGKAVNNSGGGSFVISGGTLTSAEGSALYNANSSKAYVEGGTLTTTAGYVIDNAISSKNQANISTNTCGVIYLSGTPTFNKSATGNVVATGADGSLVANNGEPTPTYYTGDAITVTYTGSFVSKSTVLVAGLDASNTAKFEFVSTTERARLVGSTYVIYTLWTLTYNSNRTPVETHVEYVVDGDTAMLTSDVFTVAGYEFLGWLNMPDDLAIAYDKTGDKIEALSANTTIYAKWQPNTYSITYYLEGGEISGQPTTHVYGTPTDIPEPTRTGYGFGGWKINDAATADADRTLTLGGTAYTANIELHATWLPNSYAITYFDDALPIAAYSAGATPAMWANGYTTKTLHYFDARTTLATSAEVVKRGYEFVGWFESPLLSGEPITYIERGAREGGVALYSKWQVKTYTVTYQDGTGIFDSWAENYASYPQSFAYDVTVALPVSANIFKLGNGFIGWCTTPDLNEANIITEITATNFYANLTLYAKWAPAVYDIAYDNLTTGYTLGANSPISYVFGSLVAIPDATREGYAFAGWNVNSTFVGKNINVNTANYGAGLTLVATWTAERYGITYYDGATEPMVIMNNAASYWATGYTPATTHVYGSPTVLPTTANFNIRGYSLEGWYRSDTDEKITTTINEGGQTVLVLAATAYRSSISIYAKWTANSYAINANLNGGIATIPAYHTYDDATSVPTPQRDGYSFSGWSVNGSSLYVTNLTLGATDYVSAISLNAVWQLLEPEIIVSANVSSVYDSTTKTISVTATHYFDDSQATSYFYQWYKNGAIIGGANTRAYTVKNVNDSANYTCNVRVTVGGDNRTKLSDAITVSITPREITVIPQENQSKVYGATDPQIRYTYDLTNVLANETPRFTGSLSRVPGDNVSSYDIQLGTLAFESDDPFNAANYSLLMPASAVQFRITKAVLTITANNKEINYKDAAPTYDASFTGFKYNQNSSVLGGGDFECSYSIGSNADSYDVTPKNFTSNNYSFNYIAGTLLVKKQSVTISADNKTSVYGDSSVALTWTSSIPRENLDSAVVRGIVLIRETGSNVGRYSISVSPISDSLSVNYTFAYTTGLYEITTRDVTVQIESKSSIYGEPIKNLTWRWGGGRTIVNNDDLKIVLSKSGGLSSGIYTITGVSNNTNYTVTFNTAQYVIYQAELQPDRTQANQTGVLVNCDGGFNVAVSLQVNEPPLDDYSDIDVEAFVGVNTEIKQLYSIKLLNSDAREISIDSAMAVYSDDARVTVKLFIAEAHRGVGDLTVVHIADDGTMSVMDDVYIDGEYIVFTTDHFSAFAIVGSKVFDSYNLFIILLVVMIFEVVICACLYIAIRIQITRRYIRINAAIKERYGEGATIEQLGLSSLPETDTASKLFTMDDLIAPSSFAQEQDDREVVNAKTEDEAAKSKKDKKKAKKDAKKEALAQNDASSHEAEAKQDSEQTIEPKDDKPTD